MPCVSSLLSVSVVCLSVEVWVGEQLQVATGKSNQVRVGGYEVRRGWMKANKSGEGQSN